MKADRKYLILMTACNPPCDTRRLRQGESKAKCSGYDTLIVCYIRVVMTLFHRFFARSLNAVICCKVNKYATRPPCMQYFVLVICPSLLLTSGVHRGAGHAFGEAADVVLEGVVVLLQFVVVGFDILDFFD